MKCKECIHKNLCVHKLSVENFADETGIGMFMTIGVTQCALCNNEFITMPESFEEPTKTVQIDKDEEVIKDFSKRSEMIKNSYRDASGGDVVCPTCKSNVKFLSKCVVCDKPICSDCGVEISLDAKKAGLMCHDCWEETTNADDKAQEEAIQLDVQDSSFLKTVVRHDIPYEK